MENCSLININVLPNVFSMYAASSTDALGTIPGSLNAVRSNVDITKINNHAATKGMAGDTFLNKYGQLQNKNKLCNYYSILKTPLAFTVLIDHFDHEITNIININPIRLFNKEEST